MCHLYVDSYWVVRITVEQELYYYEKKYTEYSLIEKYKNLTSLIEYYKSLNLDDYRETNILAVGDLEKFVGKDIYNRSFSCEKLLNLEKELHELISRKDFNIDYGLLATNPPNFRQSV